MKADVFDMFSFACVRDAVQIVASYYAPGATLIDSDNYVVVLREEGDDKATVSYGGHEIPYALCEPIDVLLKTGYKIVALKLVRAVCNLGLKEAKAVVDDFIGTNG